MHIRPLEIDDYSATIDLLTQTFRPFLEGYARPLLGEKLFHHQHGQWEQDYGAELPTLHAPDVGRHAAVATLADGTVSGLVSWRFDPKPRHGEIYLLAVSALHRRQHIGRSLCEHAIADLRTGIVEVVQISTGGDSFHAPARAVYKRLGFTQVPGVPESNLTDTWSSCN